MKWVYRGIQCRIANEHGQILGGILEPIDLAKYVWKLGTSEAYVINEKSQFEDFFTDEDYEQGIKGVDLQKRFQSDSYYTIFISLQAFPSELTTVITTYEDFVRSDCEMVILLADCTYLDIYCKNQQLIERLYQHALDLGVTDLHYISQENDDRTSLVIF